MAYENKGKLKEMILLIRKEQVLREKRKWNDMQVQEMDKIISTGKMS